MRVGIHRLLAAGLLLIGGCSADALPTDGTIVDRDLALDDAAPPADLAMEAPRPDFTLPGDFSHPPAQTVTLTSTMVPTVDSPTAIAVGDFNSDGIPDVAVTSASSGGIAVHAGQAGPQSGLGDPIDTALGAGALSAIAVADFNGDQKPDVVVIDARTPSYWVLRGQGAAKFVPAKYALAYMPVAIGPKDLDKNGTIDLAISGESGGAGSLHVLAGDGAGGFAERSVFAVGMRPWAISWGDLNGDGMTDVAIADPLAGQVFTALGAGGFNFMPASPQGAARSVTGVVLGDFDQDGKADAVASLLPANAVGFMKGGGDGSLALKSNYATGLSPSRVVAADFDSDGRIDVATPDRISHTVSVLRGYGDGTFHVADKFNTGFTPVAIAVADFNRDGKPDLVTANFMGSSLTLLINTSQ